MLYLEAKQVLEQFLFGEAQLRGGTLAAMQSFLGRCGEHAGLQRHGLAHFVQCSLCRLLDLEPSSATRSRKICPLLGSAYLRVVGDLLGPGDDSGGRTGDFDGGAYRVVGALELGHVLANLAHHLVEVRRLREDGTMPAHEDLAQMCGEFARRRQHRRRAQRCRVEICNTAASVLRNTHQGFTQKHIWGEGRRERERDREK